MKRIILDTDMGVDCDDAVALTLLIRLKQMQKCTIEGITASTTRLGASSCIKAIMDYHGEEAEVARLLSPVLECDSQNNYAKGIMESYGNYECEEEALKLLRRKIANAEGKLTLVAIGPLTNIALLLRSNADEYSELCGIELVKSKVDSLYLMSGCFSQNGDSFYRNEPTEREWNILQDIESARYVAENFPLEMTYIPFEAGNRVFTGGALKKYGNHPACLALKMFAEKVDVEKNSDSYERESWDPITCFVAVTGGENLFDFSDYGKIFVDKTGRTVFERDNKGRHRFIIPKDNFETVSKVINSLL